MNDREMLEMAAKAAGIKGGMELDTSYVQERWHWIIPYENQNMISGIEWNPLLDDCDALRLAVKLNLITKFTFLEALAEEKDNPAQDYYAATRRAIVRVAAEIGKDMP